MTEDDVIYLLMNRDSIQKTIKKCRKYVIDIINEKNELIRQLSLPGVRQNNIVTVSGYVGDKVPNIYDKYCKIEQERMKEMTLLLETIEQEEETLNMVLQRLYCLPEPYRSITIMLYINKEKWDTVCHEYKISRATLSNIRSVALGGIVKGQLLKERTIKKGRSNTVKGQISLIDYMEENYGE